METQKEQIITSLSACVKHTGFDLLPQSAKKVYLDRCLELIRQGRLVPVFLDQIILYANAYDSYLKFDENVQTFGPVLQSRDKRGDLRSYANPAVKMRTEALRDVVRIGKNFSFSPLDRDRVDAPIVGGEDPAEALLRRWDEDCLSDEELEQKQKEEKARKRKEERAISRIYAAYGLRRDRSSFSSATKGEDES